MVPGVVARKPIGPALNFANATASSELYFCSSIVEIYKCKILISHLLKQLQLQNKILSNTMSLTFFYFGMEGM